MVPRWVVPLLLALPGVSALAAAPVDPAAARSLQAVLAAREYWASPSAGGLQAPNRAQGLRTWFEPGGVRIVDRTAPDGPNGSPNGSPEGIGLSLLRVGREGAWQEVPPGQVSHAGARVEIAREGLVEWYVNSPAGLEQGFTLSGRPEGEGPLQLEVAVGGAAVSGSGERLGLRRTSGRQLSLAKLRVEDAEGAIVPARFELLPSGYRIRVEDAGAAYPLVIDPLLTESSDGAVASNQALALLGESVASAGDVNGDGHGDVIVGAPSYDAGQAGEGAAFLFLGGPLGLSGTDPLTADTQIEGDQADAALGASVASAGDVNGDGYADVIIGAPRFDSGQTDEGVVLIFHGSASGIADAGALSADTILQSNQAGAGYGGFGVRGGAVASAGDVNGDGYADVIAAAPYYDNGETDEGVALVFHGGPGGIGSWSPLNADALIESDQAGAFLGSVASAGDVNGDGYADVIVGAGGYDDPQQNEGAAFVFLGGASGVGNGSPANADGQIETNIGVGIFDADISVASAGDVDGDGYADVIVGFAKYDGIASAGGCALVFRGGASGIAGGNILDADSFLYSSQVGSLLGASVASAGDVNGDGYADVVIGANGWDGGAADEGAAFVVLGSSIGLPALGDVTVDPVVYAELSFGQAAAEAGRSVAGAGDVDGDGFDEVLVGAPLYDDGQSNEGLAFLFLGGGTGIPDGSPANANAGILTDQADTSAVSVASAGDVNGDGYGDLLVGMAFYDAGTTDEGAVFVFHGDVSGVFASSPADADHLLHSGQSDSQFGWSAASAGDVDGDGYGDVIVGARFYDNGETDEGAAFVFHGSASGLVGSLPFEAQSLLESDQASAGLGESVASAGDVNGDGYGDVIVGAPAYDSEGIAAVFLGSPSGVVGSDPGDAHRTLVSNDFGAGFGYSVASAGDVDGDGYGDVIVGAPSYLIGGAAFVFRGSASGVLGTDPSTAHAGIESGVSGSFLGWSVASAGDVDGDGRGDVIVGDIGFSNGEANEGAAYVFLGTAGGITADEPADADAQIEANQVGADLGRRVASAGDVNGDGFADVIVGARFYDAGQTDEGAAWVFLGGPAGITASDPSGADAQIESNQAGARLGTRVAPAGDLNGDGFADVVVGANLYDATVTGGEAAFVFLGGPGRPLVGTRQIRDDGSGLPVQPWGSSLSDDSFRVRLLAAPSPRGLERGKLAVEACPAGVPFGHASCTEQVSPVWTDLSPGALFDQAVTGLTTGGLYRWRARVLYAPYTVTEPGITAPPSPRGGPWRRVQAQAVEADVRVLPEPRAAALLAGALLAIRLARRRRQR